MTLGFAPEKIEHWPLEHLHPYAQNAKTHGPDQVARIAASIAEFGWTVPVLVADDGEVIAGHGRILAATELGLTEAPVIVLGHLNISTSAGQTVTGTISIVDEGGELRIEIDAGGLAPGMHLAHLHGFAVPDPEEAVCPDAAADANGDGIVDLIEARDVAGVTLVPLTEDPASLNIMSESYPDAQEDGQMEYVQIVEPATLEEAMRDAYGTPLALETRVLFLHGVPPEAGLPDSVQSLEGVPAHATVPIGCSELKPPL